VLTPLGEPLAHLVESLPRSAAGIVPGMDERTDADRRVGCSAVDDEIAIGEKVHPEDSGRITDAVAGVDEVINDDRTFVKVTGPAMVGMVRLCM